jgi:hypothetical protein
LPARFRRRWRPKGIEYDKVIAAHGSPIPFLRKGSHDHLREAAGQEGHPGPDASGGTIVTHSTAILAWIAEQP